MLCRLRIVCLWSGFLAFAPLLSADSKYVVAERFLRAQTDLRQHRSRMLGSFRLPPKEAPKMIFDVESGSRLFLRWSKRPFQQPKTISVKLVGVDGQEAEGDLRISSSGQWGLNWYTIWLPYESPDVSILHVSVQVEELNALNPFSSYKITRMYDAKLPLGALNRKNSKKILMALENQTPWSQRSFSDPQLVLKSVESVGGQAR